MRKVLILDPVHEGGPALLQADAGYTHVHLPEPDDAAILREIADADALVLRARRLPEATWRAAKKLRLVSRHGVGCDNLDFDLLKSLGISVAIAAGSNNVSVAEQAMTLALAGCKRLIRADAAVRGHEWAIRDHLGARDMAGSAVLVIGFGQIGQAFARRAAAFEASILIHDPVLPQDAPLPEGFRRVATLEEGLSAADIISIHVPYLPQTAGMISTPQFAAMRKGAILVNTARGGIVDETALLAALDAGQPQIYATDVLADEPPAADNPLLAREDVILAPHSAAMTAQGAMRMSAFAAQNILDYFRGGLPDSKLVLKS